jgi:hypothetical protein
MYKLDGRNGSFAVQVLLEAARAPCEMVWVDDVRALPFSALDAKLDRWIASK